MPKPNSMLVQDSVLQEYSQTNLIQFNKEKENKVKLDLYYPSFNVLFFMNEQLQIFSKIKSKQLCNVC